MCKLLIITGITEPIVAKAFMEGMAVPMSKANRDGLGYSAVGPDGKLFSERWHHNPHAFSTADVMTDKIAKQLAPYENRLPVGALDPNYSRFGKIDFSDVRSITMHTRFATCGHEFANTHPFIYEDTSLIHNGVIRNAFSTKFITGLDVNKISTCDSEAALQTYLSQGVNLDTSKAKAWLDMLTGGWAFGILTRNQQGNRVLDVIRGTSFLYYMQIEGVGKVFTTSDDDAKGVAKDLGLSFVEDPILVETNEMYRYDAITGDFLEKVDIKPVYSWNRNSEKTTGSGTSTGATSGSRDKGQASGKQKFGQSYYDLLEMLKDEPEAMSLVPDIFTKDSSPSNLILDYRKVGKHTNDKTHPFIDRLQVFDMVFNRRLVSMYELLPETLKEQVRQCDSLQGFKSARFLVANLDEERRKVVG